VASNYTFGAFNVFFADTNLKLENCVKIYFASQHKIKKYYITIYDAMAIVLLLKVYSS